MLGFGVNLVTGMLFVIAAADQYIENTPFIWKIAFLMVAGANLLYLTVYDRIWELKAGQDPVLLDRAVADVRRRGLDGGHLRGPHAALPGERLLMSLTLIVVSLVVVVVVLVAVVGRLIDGSAEIAAIPGSVDSAAGGRFRPRASQR